MNECRLDTCSKWSLVGGEPSIWVIPSISTTSPLRLAQALDELSELISKKKWLQFGDAELNSPPDNQRVDRINSKRFQGMSLEHLVSRNERNVIEIKETVLPSSCGFMDGLKSTKRLGLTESLLISSLCTTQPQPLIFQMLPKLVDDSNSRPLIHWTIQTKADVIDRVGVVKHENKIAVRMLVLLWKRFQSKNLDRSNHPKTLSGHRKRHSHVISSPPRNLIEWHLEFDFFEKHQISSWSCRKLGIHFADTHVQSSYRPYEPDLKMIFVQRICKCFNRKLFRTRWFHSVVSWQSGNQIQEKEKQLCPTIDGAVLELTMSHKKKVKKMKLQNDNEKVFPTFHRTPLSSKSISCGCRTRNFSSQFHNS